MQSFYVNINVYIRTVTRFPINCRSRSINAAQSLLFFFFLVVWILIFCWPCIILYKYDETNVMHFSFSWLRTKSLYMFRALLTHPQEMLHKRYLVYCVHVMSVGCGTVAVKLQSWNSQLTLYSRNIPSAVCVAPSEDEQVMLETRKGFCFSINWMKSASRWFHYTDVWLWLVFRPLVGLLEHDVGLSQNI
jgi:hypothetical protein